MNPIRVQLTTEMFEALGSYWPDTRKALSPLQRSGPPSPTIDEKLIQAGILDPGKKVAQPFDRLLANLAGTDVYLDLSWNHSGGQKRLSIYSTKTIDPANLYAPTFISARQTGGLILQSPFSRQDLETELQDLLETVTDPDVNLEVGLSAEQALVLFTLMDLQRQINAVQEKFKPAAEQAPAENSWKAANILKAIEGASDTDKSLWVFSVPGRTLIPARDLSIENLQNGLAGLVNLGLLNESNDNKYSFSVLMMNIIKRFTVFGKLFWLSVHSANDDDDLPETEQEHVGYCSQGVNLAFSVFENENIRLRTLSRKSVIEMIAGEAFPTALPEWQNQTVPSIRKPAITAMLQDATLAASTSAPLKVTSMPAPIRETTVPASKKKIPQKLIVGFAVTMVLACLLVLAGAALVVLIQMKII